MSNTSLLGSYGGQAGDGLLFRNRIVNGAMTIDQRNSGAAVTTEAYCLDRWRTWMSAAPGFSVQQNAGSVTPPAGFTNYLGCTVTNAITPGASQRWSIQQSIEGFNVADLAWGTANAQSVAVSFWARSSLTGTLGGVIRNSAGNRAYPFTYSVSAANTWEYKTVIIPGDTSGTWLTNNGIGLSLVFSLGAGSSLVGAAGSWAGSDLWSATGSVNVIATAGATLYITGVQLEAGPTATPFERRPYSVELGMCQRYLPAHIGPGGYGAGICYASNLAGITIKLPVTARVAPTGAAISSVGHFALRAANGAGLTATNFTLSVGGIESCQVELNVASGLVQGQATMLQSSSTDAKILFTGCEL